jgi:tetratricopeptide (TPR) repeat protein
MYTVTFYSYKGGVGRTLALMNAAYRLAKKGKTVFILDFDLEAPGIDVFSQLGGHQQPGLLDFIGKYLQEGSVPRIEEFVSEIPWKTPGKVLFMPAGKRDGTYQTLLANMNWKEFYAKQRGFLFVENLKGAIGKIYSPDYVLVDSRTGLTDISGICTLQLPDLVVLLFGLNEQNLLGTAQIYKSITRNSLNRQIDTLLVASPVPDVPDFIGVRRERLERAKELLGSEPELILPFNAFVAFKETVLPPETGEFLNRAYDELRDKIISRNKLDLTNILKEAQRYKEAGDLELAETTYKQLLETNTDKWVVWLEYARYLRSLGRLPEALDVYKKSEQLGAPPVVLREITVVCVSLQQYSTAHEYLRRYLSVATNPSIVLDLGKTFELRDQTQAALEAFEKVTGMDTPPPLLTGALVEVGNSHLRLGNASEAVSYYRRALEKGPQVLAANFNLAVALARLERRGEAVPYFEKAIAIFEQQQQQLVRTGAPQTANVLQALGQAYAYIGKNGKALDLFSRAVETARVVQHGKIFSSIQYRWVLPEEFKEETQLLAHEVERSSSSTIAQG